MKQLDFKNKTSSRKNAHAATDWPPPSPVDDASATLLIEYLAQPYSIWCFRKQVYFSLFGCFSIWYTRYRTLPAAHLSTRIGSTFLFVFPCFCDLRGTLGDLVVTDAQVSFINTLPVWMQ
jgi:uncharacterized membrane-anchored protein